MLTRRSNTQRLDGTWRFNPDPYQRCHQQKWWLREGGADEFFPCFNAEGLWNIQVPGTWKTQFEELKWYDGYANYMLDFDVDNPIDDGEVFLCFDGVTYHCELYLNGFHLGSHEWGYSPFVKRVTDIVRPKRNRLFVLVDSHIRQDRVPGIRCDWNNDGGITGSVTLVSTPRTYVQNFRTQTKLIGNRVQIDCEVLLQGRCRDVREQVRFEIPELEIAIDAEIACNSPRTLSVELARDGIQLWSPDAPKLYETRVVTRHETLNDEIGYREIRRFGREIYLNGEPIRLYGVAVHSEFPGTGRTPTDEGIERMVTKARELGCNFLRCAHYPYAEQFGRAMDRLGMLWWEEVPVYWLPRVHEEPQRSHALGMLRETIVRDWNRASLIFWSVSNECAGDGTPKASNDSLETANYPYWVDACKLVRNLDPSRLISSADSGYRATLQTNWSPAAGDAFDDDVSEQVWLPAHPDAFYELLDVLGANLYVYDPDDNPAATDKLVAMLKPYGKPIMITEFGSMSTLDDDPTLPRRSPGETGHPERHAATLRTGYRAAHRHREIVGMVPWCLMDVRVPMHWRWYNRGSSTFAYGLLTNDFLPKQVFAVAKDEIARLKEAWK